MLDPSVAVEPQLTFKKILLIARKRYFCSNASEGPIGKKRSQLKTFKDSSAIFRSNFGLWKMALLTTEDHEKCPMLPRYTVRSDKWKLDMPYRIWYTVYLIHKGHSSWPNYAFKKLSSTVQDFYKTLYYTQEFNEWFISFF